MSKFVFLLSVLLAPFALFASGSGGEVESDIVERVINFIMFVAILYYLLADRIKEFFVGRKNQIAEELELVQQRLKESKKKKEEAEMKLQSAKKAAEEIIASAKKEVSVIKEQGEASKKQTLENLAHSYHENMDLEKKKAQREVVREIVEDLFSDSGMQMEDDGYAQIILKKVA